MLSILLSILLCALPLVAAAESAGGVGTSAPEPSQRAIVELTIGSRGEDVREMQQRLHVLGFFSSAIDGIYGQNTALAVQALEVYLQALEQAQIDLEIARLATPAATATPAPTLGLPTTATAPAATANPSAAGDPFATIAPPAAIAPSPTELPGTPPPTATPLPTPTTVVDGVAEPALVAMLLEEGPELYLADVRRSDQGINAARLQTRLIALNYLSGAADGIAGVNTEAAIAAFQQASGLEPTGVADRETQRLLYSAQAPLAARPVYNYLKLGSYGQDVINLQRQLRILGFYTGGLDGTYQDKTIQAVKALQQYLHDLDKDAEALLEEFTPVYAARTPGTTQAARTPAATQAPSAEERHAEIIASDPETNPYEVMPEAALSAAADSGDGFVPSGEADSALQTLLYEEGIPLHRRDVQKGDTGGEALRLQRRLYTLAYLTANGLDGIIGNGSEHAIRAFQRRNKLTETGTADWQTQQVLYSEDAVKMLKPYTIKISVNDQRVYVYALDAADEYTQLVKTMVCSTGTKANPTPLGTFTNTGPGARWHYFKKFECWAQYAFYIDGDIMFHSVIYSQQDERTLQKSSLNNLGRRASHGCVRLSVEDAKWLYNNCVAGTLVTVY